MNARDAFYRTLGDDLTFYENKSVLYQYLDEEQEKRAGQDEQKNPGKARSYQLRIRYYRRLLKEEKLSPEEYLRLLLEVLLQKPQFARRCGKPEKDLEGRRISNYISRDPQPLLHEMLGIALGNRKSEKRANVGQNMQIVYDILGTKEGKDYEAVLERLGERGFWKPPFTKLMILTDAVLDVAVAYDIREFFFDTVVEQQEGYSVAKRQKGSGEGKAFSRAQRTDKSLKLIDSYCQKRGKTLFGAGSGGEGRREPGDMECDALYRCLLEEGNEEVFVPLLVDSVTGCGIYLLGKAYFEGNGIDDPEQLQEMEQSCAYSVLFLDNDYGEDIRTGYHINNGFGEFQDYNAARFDGDFSYEKARQDAEATLKESNGKLPKGIPDVFRRYFEDDTEQEMGKYRQEVHLQLAECEWEIREEERKRMSRKNT